MHTPAPWTIGKSYTHELCIRESEEYSEEPQAIAVCCELKEGEMEANAKLIAAAPELLAACKAAKLSIIDDEIYYKFKPVLETLEKAIEKAEGKP